MTRRTNPPTPNRNTSRTKRGVELGSSLAELDENPRSRPWLDLAREWCGPSLFSTAVTATAAGEVLSLTIHAGRIEAEIVGRPRKPWRVRLTVPTWREDEWERAMRALGSHAGVASALLSGALPPELDAVLADQGLHFAPTALEGLGVQCNCDAERPGSCPHVAMALIAVANRVVDSPPSQLVLRGSAIEHVLEKLARHRTIAARGRITAHPDSVVAHDRSAAPPLESQVSNFWSGPIETRHEPRPLRRQVSHSLLRRMGPSPMGGRFPIAGLLASVYDAVREAVNHHIDQLGVNANGEGQNDSRGSRDAS